MMARAEEKYKPKTEENKLSQQSSIYLYREIYRHLVATNWYYREFTFTSFHRIDSGHIQTSLQFLNKENCYNLFQLTIIFT